MMPVLLLLAAALAAYGAFVCLALSMPRHWAAASGQQLTVVPYRRCLRAGGSALLGVTYALCVGRDGPSFGAVLWVVLISIAALAVAFTLAWQPRLFGAAARYVRRR